MKTSSVVFLVGPSAVGKSETALKAAPKLNAEIICCDAMQVYREAAIVSDKPSLEARTKVTHHMLDVVSVRENFNVARYREGALSAIKDVQAHGKVPLIVGGSGMYMTVLLDGIFEGIAVEEDLREELSLQLEERGPAVLHDQLKGLDPQAADKIHPNDPQRIIRALEVVISTEKPLSELQKKRNGLWGNMAIKIFALNRPRQELYQRAETRIDEMFKMGIVDEIKRISILPISETASKIIGVPEITGYFKNEYDLERAQYLMKLHTRHYIKRQLTWFRRDKRLTWIDITPEQTAKQVADNITGLVNE